MSENSHNTFDVFQWANEVDEIKKVAHEKRIKLQNKSAEQNVHKDSLSRLPQPNSMQTEFTKKVNDLRALGESKALLISATGTGKTYASAFALRDFNPKRALFLVFPERLWEHEDVRRVYRKLKRSGQ